MTNMMRRAAALGLAMLATLALGCPFPDPQDVARAFARLFPTIGDIEISRDAIHQSQPTVKVEIHDPENTESHVFVEEVLLAYRSTSVAELPFVEVGPMTQQGTSGTITSWQAPLPPLSLGPYEVRIQGRLKHALQEAEDPSDDDQPGLFLVKTQAFQIATSPACFAFGSDVEGWTLDGIRDIQTADAEPDGEVETFPLMSPGLLQLNGAAMMSLGQGTLPGSEPASGSWALDFVSPDLSQADAWQNLQAIVFQVSSVVPVKVQPILFTEDTNGGEHLYAPGTAGNRIFYDVSQTLRTLEWSFALPEGSTVTGLRIRVFVEPIAASGQDVFCRLHAVCPTSGTP